MAQEYSAWLERALWGEHQGVGDGVYILHTWAPESISGGGWADKWVSQLHVEQKGDAKDVRAPEAGSTVFDNADDAWG